MDYIIYFDADREIEVTEDEAEELAMLALISESAAEWYLFIPLVTYSEIKDELKRIRQNQQSSQD